MSNGSVSQERKGSWAMQSLHQFLKTTVIGSLVVLVPVAVCVYIISAVIKKVLRVFARLRNCFAWGASEGLRSSNLLPSLL
jgi:apolipoprotein N-acyltransferase